MAQLGEVVFCRGDGDEENHSDIWDDTALIAAYDNAVKVMKSRLDAKKGDQVDDNAKPSGQGKSKKKQKKARKHKPRKDRQDQISSGWRVGQRCCAVFTEDGGIYEAVVKSIDNSAGTCVVRYLGYGNEETQLMEDLLPSGGKSSSLGNISMNSTSDMASESEGMEWTQSKSSPRGLRNQTQAPPQTSAEFAFSMPTLPTSLPMMQNPTGLPLPHPMHPFGAGPSMPGFSTPNSLGMGPPPPPPMLEDIEGACSDKEALYSMLISWYMSGYHTGYYQGLQSGKKKTQAKTTREKSATAAVPKRNKSTEDPASQGRRHSSEDIP